MESGHDGWFTTAGGNLPVLAAAVNPEAPAC